MTWQPYSPLADDNGAQSAFVAQQANPDPELVLTITVYSTEPGQSQIQGGSNVDTVERKTELLEAAIRELQSSTATLAEII